jgi:hypothetical protein
MVRSAPLHPLLSRRASQAFADRPAGCAPGRRAFQRRHRECAVAGTPQMPRSAGVFATGGGLFFGYFLLAVQKKVPRGLTPKPVVITDPEQATKQCAKCALAPTLQRWSKAERSGVPCASRFVRCLLTSVDGAHAPLERLHLRSHAGAGNEDADGAVRTSSPPAVAPSIAGICGKARRVRARTARIPASAQGMCRRRNPANAEKRRGLRDRGRPFLWVLSFSRSKESTSWPRAEAGCHHRSRTGHETVRKCAPAPTLQRWSKAGRSCVSRVAAGPCGASASPWTLHGCLWSGPTCVPTQERGNEERDHISAPGYS